MTDCERKGRWFFGCNFKPRYDTTRDNESFMRDYVIKTYICDVCTVCGKQVNREGQHDQAT